MVKYAPEVPTILWVDHDEKAVLEILKNIKAAETLSPLKKLGDLFNFEHTVVAEDSSLEDVVIQKVESLSHKPDLVLVDLSWGADHGFKKPALALSGRKIALALKKRFPGTPIGIYTGETLKNHDRVRLYADQFAVVLDGLTTAAGRYPNEALDGDDWKKVFDTVLESSRTQKETLPSVFTTRFEKCLSQWVPGHPHHQSPRFGTLALNLIDLVLESIDPTPTNATVTQLSGGFSGSFVFKAKVPDRSKQYIIKMDEDPSRLARELEGYSIVDGLVNYHHHLPVLGRDKAKLAVLTPEWWGAFVMEYEGSAKPIIEQAHLTADQLAKVYELVWSECLYDLYGTVAEKDTKVADIITEKTLASAKENWKAMGRYKAMADSLYVNLRNDISQFEVMLKGPSPGDAILKVPWVEKVHGDLNCRNILYDEKSGNFCLIDFPNVGEPNCLAVDFAKAEAELILIIMDHSTGFDCDLGRIKAWGEAIEAVSGHYKVASSLLPDEQVNRTVSAIRAIRNAYEAKGGSRSNAPEAYRLYLLATILPYIGYGDITVAKKLLAASWASRLVNTKW